MPVVQIFMWEGHNAEKKEEIIHKVTDVMCQTIGCKQDSVTVLLLDMPRTNWGAGGTQASKLPHK